MGEELSAQFRSVGFDDRRVTDTLKNKALTESITQIIKWVCAHDDDMLSDGDNDSDYNMVIMT